MKQKRENTIKDIAVELGLSPSTISRALSDHPHIHEETKKKIKEVAAKMGYQYNAMAASLRNNKSNTIGLIIPRISKYYQSAAITAIQNKLHEYKYNVIICQSNESAELEKELVNALYASRVEGLIVSTTLRTVDFSHFDIFQKSNRPLVFFDRVPPAYKAHKIQGDDYTGGYLATKHLLEIGCRRIAHIGGLLTCNIYCERFAGYRDALTEYGLKVNNELVFFQDLTSENALKAAKNLFSKKINPDAVFGCNDTSAIAVMQYAKSLGIEMPSKLKIIGYSNDPLSAIIDPSLSSIEQHPDKVGARAAELMMELISQKLKPGKRFLKESITVELVKRRSTSPARKPANKNRQINKLKVYPGKKNPLKS